MKKWNATRWLGRAACLSALCDAYLYILNHLEDEIKTTKDKKVSLQLSRFQFAKLLTNISIATKESPRSI